LQFLSLILVTAWVPALIGCNGGVPEGGEKSVAILSEIMPRDQAIQEVRAKGPKSTVRRAWQSFEDRARDRVEKAKRQMASKEKQQVANQVVTAREAEYQRGSRARWDKWVASGQAKGHLLEHLLVMRRLGQSGLEKVVGEKFRSENPSNMSFETPKGIRVTASMYGDGRGPITGFSVGMVDGSALTQQNVLQKLGLPEAEFRPVPSKWGSMYRWKKLPKSLGYGDDIAGVGNNVVVFWQGP
jgi:hypothetical protein